MLTFWKILISFYLEEGGWACAFDCGEKRGNICKEWLFLFFYKRDKHIVKGMKEITEKWGLRESTCWKTEHINQAMGMGGIKTVFYTTLILIKDKSIMSFFPFFFYAGS